MPIANFEQIPDCIPYVYYNPELIKHGIPSSTRDEVLLLSSVDEDIRRISLKYYSCVCVASEKG